MEQHEKIADLIQQLKDAGVNLSEITTTDQNKTIEDLKKKDGVSNDLIEKLRNADSADFALFGAWNKSF